MKKALIMKLTILLLALSLSACATVHKVNIDVIEANKNKTFTIGIVKVTGRTPFGFGSPLLDRKITVLQKIPVKEICDVLFANYGINVNPDFNRTIKVVDERSENPPHVKGENPYWGNKEYNEPGLLRRILFFEAPTIIDDDIGDTVSITYSFRVAGPPWALKDETNYEVTVKSDAEVLVQHMGEIATVDMPKKGLFLDLEGVWNDVTTYVEKIPEALARDIKAMK
jgi:predicted small secreted protein